MLMEAKERVEVHLVRQCMGVQMERQLELIFVSLGDRHPLQFQDNNHVTHSCVALRHHTLHLHHRTLFLSSRRLTGFGAVTGSRCQHTQHTTPKTRRLACLLLLWLSVVSKADWGVGRSVCCAADTRSVCLMTVVC